MCARCSQSSFSQNINVLRKCLLQSKHFLFNFLDREKNEKNIHGIVCGDLLNATHSIIKNNIFYDQKHSVFDIGGDTTGLVIDYNLVYNSDGSLPEYLPYPILHELRGVNPKFVNPSVKDYRLQSGSLGCISGESGTYIGASPCNNVIPSPISSPTLTATIFPTPTLTPTKPPTSTETRMAFTVNPTGTDIIIMPTHTPTKFPEIPFFVIVADRGSGKVLNMRSLPTIWASVPAYCYAGSKFEVVEILYVKETISGVSWNNIYGKLGTGIYIPLRYRGTYYTDWRSQ